MTVNAGLWPRAGTSDVKTAPGPNVQLSVVDGEAVCASPTLICVLCCQVSCDASVLTIFRWKEERFCFDKFFVECHCNRKRTKAALHKSFLFFFLH